MAIGLKGQQAMAAKLNRIAAKFPDRVAGALRVEAELILTASKQKFVPIDTGTLKNSGHVEKPVRVGRELSISLSYGGAASAYALSVHENPSGYDPPSWKGVAVKFRPRGRGAKYLERPLRDAVPGMQARLAARLHVDKGAA